jgi:hypothetical protein
MLPQLVDPEEQVKWGHRAANALLSVIRTKKKPVMMNGEQYLEFEDWQVLGRFCNYTVGTESTREVIREGKIQGFEAKAIVKNSAGIIISSAEASCLRDEPKWNMRPKYALKNNVRVKIGEELVPEFQLKSMAQTRACAKALRNVLAWVVILAGYRPTPAEEMDIVASADSADAPAVGQYGEPLTDKELPKNAATPKKAVQYFYKCSDCQAKSIEKHLTPAESAYSMQHYGMELCRVCQTKYKKKQ